MEYNYGNLIKVERMRKNMKQSVLARGICSVSYLSKIENNQTSASEEVLELLFKRLSINAPLYINLSEQVQKIKLEMRDLLKEAILTRNDRLLLPKLLKYKDSPVVNQTKELYITLMITLARFGLMPNGNPQHVIELGWLENQFDFDNTLRYKLLKCLYIHHFQNEEREHALKLLEEVDESLPNSHIPDWEVADMRYIMGAIYIKYKDYLQVIEHTRFALSYFQDHFYIERIVECHLLIGVAYKRRKRYLDALSHYEKASKIAQKTSLKDYNGMLFNNMGDIYFLIGDQEKALKYFLESFEYKVDIRSKLYSVMSLLEVNSENKNVDGVIEWLNIGYELMGNINNAEEFNHHFNIYKYEFVEPNKEKLIMSLKEAVHFFETHDENYTNKYALWLARELRENGKYKLATEYYEKTVAIMSRWE